MSPVEFKKTPCHPVEFKGQGPLVGGTRCMGALLCMGLPDGTGAVTKGEGRGLHGCKHVISWTFFC